MHDVACEFACAVRMRSSNGRERRVVESCQTLRVLAKLAVKRS